MLAGARRASSLEALADKLGMPGAALRTSLDAYNAAARGEIADPTGKSAQMCASLETGPWLAIDIYVNSRVFPCPAITLGGLSVEESSGRVLAAAGGAPIAGLYAVGRTAVGIASNHYVSGLSLADCIWSGRNAGRHLTRQPAGDRQAHTNQETSHEPTY
jgi:3-oxo-5alpha-steroid 4-dehydrogenase